MANLDQFINQGIKNISDTAIKFYLGNRKGQAFMLRTISSLHKATKIRNQYEQQGTHIPPFLIASIASSCNLHCAGCYARANGSCGTGTKQAELQKDDWNNIFTQARDIGVSFILLAGGEPLLRRDIITAATNYPEIIFPIFTNGTIIDEEYLTLFDQHRNLIPVVSIEGDEKQTDRRRGEGVTQQVLHTTEALQERGILYGASITVTSENKDNVTQQEFITTLRNRGCGLLFFIEYVPVEEGTEKLILDDEQLKELQSKIDALRQDKRNKGMIMLSFPGDEEAMGGCLAAGRGFFHINPTGGAEPCPFSPYSELNAKEKTLLEILQSPFFEKVREISAAEALNHKGGCTLFQYEKEVASCKS